MLCFLKVHGATCDLKSHFCFFVKLWWFNSWHLNFIKHISKNKIYGNFGATTAKRKKLKRAVLRFKILDLAVFYGEVSLYVNASRQQPKCLATLSSLQRIFYQNKRKCTCIMVRSHWQKSAFFGESECVNCSYTDVTRNLLFLRFSQIKSFDLSS